MLLKHMKVITMAAGLLFASAATAVTYTDNFSNTTTTQSWNALGSACLTAGTGATGTAGVIPGCSPAFDATGHGALRLTSAATSQVGAILSNFTFPSSQGLQVTFTTYTYGGNSYGKGSPNPANGADGIAFILTDGTKSAPTATGRTGGSLGYSCGGTGGNTTASTDGIANGFLGLGIDEYGNFLNAGDNSSDGVLNTNAAGGVSTYGSNPYQNNITSFGGGQGPYYQSERIGLRGAGNTTWAALQILNSSYYSGSISDTGNAAKFQDACANARYVTSTSIGPPLTYSPIQDYNVIAGGYRVLPTTQLIANEAATTRAGTAATSSAAATPAATPIIYKLNISSAGLLNFSYSYNNGAFQPVLVNTSIGTVPNLLRFGFSSSTGGGTNIHEITCFSASPLQSNSSAGANTVQSGQLQVGSQLFLATYTSDSWWGSVVSDSVNVATDGTLSVSSVANWDANCDITGGDCPSLGTDASGNATKPPLAPQTPSTRTLLTWSGTAGSAFEWANLTTTQQGNLNTNSTTGTNDNAGSSRLDWLRGGRTNEQLAGSLRARAQVLGDIINSSPTFVGAPAANTYPDAFIDYTGTTVPKPENASGAQTYSAFVTASSGRQNIVYAGSNDGFLHGFAAGAPTVNSNGTNSYNSSSNNGTELLGFMPAGVLANPSIVSLTSPTYVHNYFVDATPVASDLFYAGAWHTWLVGGVGSAGSEIYALDITDPTKFAETNANNVVIGDWTSATPNLSGLGNTAGTPIIARMHSGQWAIIFGNGQGSSGDAGVYIGLVDKNSTKGAVTFQFLDTGTPSPDAITYVTSVDLDGDQIADYLYAGDTQGNVWRFDVTSGAASNWAVSKFGNTAATPLYIAKSSSTSTPASALQPITTVPVVAAVTVGGGNRVMVMFGTGQKTPFTNTSGDVYATGSQTFYGIWDWDMTAWNAKAISSAQYVTLSGQQSVDRTKLLQQTLTSTTVGSSTSGQVLGYRNLPVGTVVCWQGSTTCSSGNSQYGWLFDLPSTNEQIIYNPTLIGGAVVVNTAIPPVVSAQACNSGLQSGWTMAFDPASGGGISQSFFPNASGSTSTTSGSAVAGIQLNGVGTPSSLTYNGQTYLVTQTVNGTSAISKVYPPSNASRVSWKEIRY